jgi:hypothetical protein
MARRELELVRARLGEQGFDAWPQSLKQFLCGYFSANDQARIDLAIGPHDSMTGLVTVDVPAGMTVYEGAAAGQGGILLGGGDQAHIPHVNPARVR